MELVSVKNIVFGYGQTPALNGVSFQINSGEFTGVTGPNGASKVHDAPHYAWTVAAVGGKCSNQPIECSRKTTEHWVCSAADCLV